MSYPANKRDRIRLFSNSLQKEFYVKSSDTAVELFSNKDQEVQFRGKLCKFQKWKADGSGVEPGYDYDLFAKFDTTAATAASNKAGHEVAIAAVVASAASNATNLTSAVATLSAADTAETSRATAAENANTSAVSAMDTAYKAADSALDVAYKAADAVVQADLDAHKAAYNTRVADVDTAINFLTSNTTAQIDSVADLLSEINEVKADMGDDGDENNSLAQVIAQNVTKIAALEAALAQLTQA